MRRPDSSFRAKAPYVWLVCGTIAGASGSVWAQIGGFEEIDPVSIYDPLYAPSTQFPNGQYWIPLTKVDYAWRLVGYDHTDPPAVDFNNPASTIAIIDTGIDLDHFEFTDGPGGSKVHPDSISFFESGSGGFPSCLCEPSIFAGQPPEDTASLPHGTILAGVAGAYVNGQGMAGVCWDCDLLVLRFWAVSSLTVPSCNLPTTRCEQTEGTVAAAIRYAAGWNGTGYNPEPRARIISASFNSPNFDDIDCSGNIIQDAVNEAYAQGCIIIVAAGNSPNVGPCWQDSEKCEPSTGFQPLEIETGIAIMPNTITVGGACLTGDAWHCWSRVNPLVSNFTDCCPAADETDWCDLYYPLPWPWPAEGDRLPVLSVVAPMTDMFSTWADGVVGTSNHDFDSFVDGTSIVPPQIAGIVALMLKANPTLTFEEVKQILEVTATDITEAPASVGYDRYTGHGLVNARKAVQRAILQGLPADWNGDGVIAPIDPLLYLADYGAGDPMTDLDLDTVQTSNDMTIFLDSYNGN